MSPSTHSDFIFLPISNILREAVSASAGIGAGIETFPLCDYVMQSIFIKMTGFQEQKLKCICWDAASIDFEYRYQFTKNPLGECSSYADKNSIYKDLIRLAKKNGSAVNEIFSDREGLIESAANEIFETFDGTNLAVWAQAAFLDFLKIKSSIKRSHIASESDIFSDSTLKSWYTDNLYRHRNRVAHNTSSYQQNLPTLKTLMDEKYKYENYFLFFFMLTLVDKIFIEVHGEFLRAINERAD
jgi:hypothetical protein